MEVVLKADLYLVSTLDDIDVGLLVTPRGQNLSMHVLGCNPKDAMETCKMSALSALDIL